MNSYNAKQQYKIVMAVHTEAFENGSCRRPVLFDQQCCPPSQECKETFVDRFSTEKSAAGSYNNCFNTSFSGR